MKKISICPVCFSDQIKPYLKAPNQHGKTILKKNDKFSYYQCNNCGVVFLDGIPIDKTYYQTYYSFPESNNKSSYVSILEKKFDTYSNRKKKKLVEYSIRSKKGKVALLDIGCGRGNFLASLDKKKFESVGIERDKKEYLVSKKKNLTVYCSDILHQSFGNKKFDVITLWHVIEHIPEPHKLFKKISLLLKKDGVVIITTPNAQSLGFKIAQEKWFHLDAPRHLILYNKKGIKTLSKNNAFQLKNAFSDTFEFPLDLFWSIKQSKTKYFIYPLYPIMKYLSKETLTFVLTKSNEK